MCGDNRTDERMLITGLTLDIGQGKLSAAMVQTTISVTIEVEELVLARVMIRLEDTILITMETPKGTGRAVVHMAAATKRLVPEERTVILPRANDGEVLTKGLEALWLAATAQGDGDTATR